MNMRAIASLIGCAFSVLSQASAESCNCSPRQITFQLDFDRTCNDSTIFGDGVKNSDCFVSPAGVDQDVTDFTPVMVTGIDILELDKSLVPIAFEPKRGSYRDGDTIVYTTLSDEESNSETLYGGIQLNILDANSIDQSIQNVFIITYTNSCGFSVLQEGDGIGWLVVDSIVSSWNEQCGQPTLSPSSAPTTSPTQCTSRASALKLESTTGEQIHIFDVKVVTTEYNDIAKEGVASQSSTFKDKFSASNVNDNDVSTFSHTNDSNAWLQLDFNEDVEVYYVEISNRYCGDSSDVNGCLCRLTNATLSLLDDAGRPIAKRTLGNTCGKTTLSYDFRCSPETECYPSGSKLKLLSTTGEPIQVLEVEAFRSYTESNVALNQPASQSTTLDGNNKFAASMAVDGDYTSTFSHTDQSTCDSVIPWWEVELDGFPIDLVYIKNRACLNEESKGCLCRLSEAIVILYDDMGTPVYTKMLGDMCGEYDWTYEYAKSSEYCKVFDG